VPSPAQAAKTARFPDVAKELRENGVALCRGFFDPAAVNNLEQWWKEIQNKIESGRLSRQNRFVNLIRNSNHISMPDETFFNELYKEPALVELAQSVLSEDICHWISRLLLKDVHSSDAVECHQDWPYSSGNTTKLSVMIPLTRHTEQNGKLYYLEKSHLYGPITRGTIALEQYPELKHVGPDLEVGDVLVHDYLTWHYSVPSQDRSDRAVIQIVYQPSSDPSSKELVCGRITNPFVCGAWEDPVAQIGSPWTTDFARSLWKDTALAVWYPRLSAAKICDGIIAQGGTGQLSCYALLAEMAIAEGRLADASAYLDKLKTGHAEVSTTIDELETLIRGQPAETGGD
jgi:hypothetical protein